MTEAENYKLHVLLPPLRSWRTLWLLPKRELLVMQKATTREDAYQMRQRILSEFPGCEVRLIYDEPWHP